MNTKPPRLILSPQKCRRGAFTSISELLIDWDPVKKITSAKNIFQVPKVTMNGGNLKRVTSNPLKAPVAIPEINPTAIAGRVGTPISTESLPMNTDAKTIIAATLKSIPAVNIIRVWAAARIPTIVTCCTIRDKLKAEKNFPPAMKPNAITLNIKIITGTIVGLPWRKCWIFFSVVCSPKSKEWWSWSFSPISVVNLGWSFRSLEMSSETLLI